MSRKKKRVGILVFTLILLVFTGCDKRGKETVIQKTDYQKEISAQVLRFHIRASSDTKEDQELKLKVKNQIVAYLQELLKDCSSKEMCKTKINIHLHEIEELGRKVCQKEGKTVLVHACLIREEFPLKEYGDLIFPSGVYDALRVDLGQGEGKNWWCMMYPSLCMIDGVTETVPKESKEKLEEALSKEAYALLQKKEEKNLDSKEISMIQEGSEQKYHIKWKIIESFWQYFSKK